MNEYLDPQAIPATTSLRAGAIVAHRHQHPTHGTQVRHGLVTKVHDPVIIDADQNTAIHADVAWFGLDGLCAVPVDELDQIG